MVLTQNPQNPSLKDAHDRDVVLQNLIAYITSEKCVIYSMIFFLSHFLTPLQLVYAASTAA